MQRSTLVVVKVIALVLECYVELGGTGAFGGCIVVLKVYLRRPRLPRGEE